MRLETKISFEVNETLLKSVLQMMVLYEENINNITLTDALKRYAYYNGQNGIDNIELFSRGIGDNEFDFLVENQFNKWKTVFCGQSNIL